MNDGSSVQQRFSRLIKMRDILILAFGYFVAGYVGMSLAVPPGYATIIWPASGIALCALLLRRGNIWPGIWLGSFAFNCMAGFDSSADLSEAWPSFAVAASLGLGASAQALVGMWIARRFVHGIDLSNLRQVALSTFLTVFLPSVIAPTIGVTTLLVAGTIDAGLILTNLVTWYFGDTLGVLLIMPILLLSNRSPFAIHWHGRPLHGTSSLVAISLIATIMLTFYAWRFISEREHAQAEASFAAIAGDTDQALHYRLEIYQKALRGGAAFAALEGQVSPARWREYVEHLEITQSYPGMRGFGIFEEVLNKDLPEFRDRFAREFGDRFRIHPRVQRETHYVINRIEPLSSNLQALGLDLAFEQGRREAIALSMESEGSVLTRPIVLVQDARQGFGFLLMLPIIDDTGAPTGRWVYSPLVADEIFAALTPRQAEDFTLEVYHGSQGASEKLLFSSGEVNSSPRFELQQTMDLAGQPITLRWTSLPAFETRLASSAPVLALASGLLITLLLGILLVIFMRRESHVLREVKDATAELEERNRMLMLAEATAHIGHWHFNLADNSIRWSDEVHRLHGLEPGHAPALEKAMDFYHPDDRPIIEQSLQTALADGQPYSLKARLISESGEMRHVEVRGQVEKDSEGNTTGILGVIIDRTEETIMREQLTETIEKAHAADHAKSSFLANMSHEIRTPMNGVIGFTELALADEKVPEQKRRLQLIADSSNAMLRLLNDLLDFAKIEAKHLAIVKEPTDLRHTLRSCQRLMEPVAKTQSLALVLEIGPEVPSRILVDKMRLRQIILNLLGNALKFTATGEVRISAYVNERSSDHSEILFIKVTDTGIGIPANRLDSIFEKFTQADETTARRYGGTGLGLPISAELAGLMGGELRASSEVGKGSSFTLSIPLEQVSQNRPVALTDEPAEEYIPTNRLRIIIAEDNPINQELTIDMVKKAGHDYELARDGREVVNAVLEAERLGHPYDIVLMDMQMPQMDGLQASRAIRDAGITAEKLPILAVTANAYSDDVQLCKDAGMQAHLAKPLRLKVLCSAINEWSRHFEPEQQVPDQAIEEVGDPRLRQMFEKRKVAAVESIDIVLNGNHINKADVQATARLLHQIAGVAAFFGQAELGESCRLSQHEIVGSQEDTKVRELLKAIRRLLSADAPPSLVEG